MNYGKPFNHIDLANTGEVVGAPGIAYKQGDQLYNAQKQPVNALGHIMPLPPEAVAPAPAAEAPKAAAASKNGDDDDTPADEKAFDLKAWAMGEIEATMTFSALRSKAISLTGNTEIRNKIDARNAVLAYYGLPIPASS